MSCTTITANAASEAHQAEAQFGTRSTPDAPKRTGSPGLTLFAALLGFFMIGLDASAVNVALP